MPAGLLYGAAGAAEGLETLLARRLREAQFAEQQRAAQETEGFRTRQLDETTRLREAQQAETERMHRETEAARKAAEDRQRLTIRLGSLEPGATMDQAERDYLVQQGMSPSSFGEVYTDPATRHPLGPHAPGGTGGVYGPPDFAFQGPDVKPEPGPAMFRYAGRTADRLRQEQIAAQEEIAALNRQNQLTMAQLAAATRLQAAGMQGGQVKVMKIRTPDGRDMDVLVDGSGRIVFGGDSQLPGGMKKEAGNLQGLLQQIAQVRGMGEQSGWKGTGVVAAPYESFMKRTFGLGSDTADQLRASIDSLKADIAHEKYGSAFTATERGMLQSFAAGSNMDPSAIKNRLATMERIINTRLGEMQAGRAPTPINFTQGGIVQDGQIPAMPQPGLFRSTAPGVGPGGVQPQQGTGKFRIISVQE